MLQITMGTPRYSLLEIRKWFRNFNAISIKKNNLLYLFMWRNTPQWVGATSSMRLYVHTILGVAPLGDWTSLSIEIYLTNSTFTRDTHHGQAGFEPTIPASERSQNDTALSGECLCLGERGGESWTRTNLKLLLS